MKLNLDGPAILKPTVIDSRQKPNGNSQRERDLQTDIPLGREHSSNRPGMEITPVKSLTSSVPDVLMHGAFTIFTAMFLNGVRMRIRRIIMLKAQARIHAVLQIQLRIIEESCVEVPGNPVLKCVELPFGKVSKPVIPTPVFSLTFAAFAV